MKKIFRKPETEIPAADAASQALPLRKRFSRKKAGLSVRIGISLHFLLFVGLTLALLWVMQTVLLEDVYRRQKTSQLQTSAQSLVWNIDNENLAALAERIAENNNICVMITDENMEELVNAEGLVRCVIHHMHKKELLRMVENENDKTPTIGGLTVMIFPMDGFRDPRYDERKFKGDVPRRDDGSSKSMVAFTQTQTASGETRYIFMNTLITPVEDTVRTIRYELWIITALLLVLGMVIAFLLSRRIARPIVETTEAAEGLRQREYTPVEKPGYAEITRLNEQLTETAEELRKVDTMQKELIANISHDLRTPLTLIGGYAEVMRDLPGESTPENLQVIIDETQRLTTLVNAVLELSRLRQGEEKAPEVFSLTEVTEQLLHRYQKLVKQDGYIIRFEKTGDATVKADPIRMQQVLYNLINNALTYTGKDKTVIISQTLREDRVRVEVKDSGKGIAPEELPHIWERYYRGDKPHKRATVGTGLGLNIVQEILEGCAADYGVESTEGVGSTFWFEMLLAMPGQDTDSMES